MPTVHLASYLRPDHIAWDLPADDKPGILRALAAFAASHVPEVQESVVHDLLMKREDDTSTGVGGGLALPHAMVPGLDRTLLFFVRLQRPVDYDALDGDPVDLLVFLLSGPEALRLHVRLLARIARIIGPTRFLDRLRETEDADEACELLRDEDARHV